MTSLFVGWLFVASSAKGTFYLRSVHIFKWLGVRGHFQDLFLHLMCRFIIHSWVITAQNLHTTSTVQRLCCRAFDCFSLLRSPTKELVVAPAQQAQRENTASLPPQPGPSPASPASMRKQLSGLVAARPLWSSASVLQSHPPPHPFSAVRPV